MLGMKEKHIMVHERGSKPLFISMAEGEGGNLWDEDIEEGYIDYIMYNIYELQVRNGKPELVEADGGCVLCEKMVADMTDEEFTNEVLDFIYGYTMDGGSIVPLRPQYEEIEK